MLQSIRSWLSYSLLILLVAPLACTAADSEPKRLCVPGSTQACLGPGACSGAQICLSRGTTYGTCNCGDNQPTRDASITDTVIQAIDTGVPSDGGIPPIDDVGFFPDGGSIFSQTSPVAMTWVYSGPANLYFNLTEVTVAQFEACVSAGACASENYYSPETRPTPSWKCNYGEPGHNDHPMNCVNWDGANEFCAWAGARLPEAEEWLAEASNNGSRDYPWGDEPEANCDYCIIHDVKIPERGCGMGSTWPGCSKPMGNSVSGICDLVGNVWELTATVHSTTKNRVTGGSWGDDEQFKLVVTHQEGKDKTGKSSNHGFRCVSDTPP